MSLSSGTKTALSEAASWVVAGVILAGTFVYWDELRNAFSPITAPERAAMAREVRKQPAKPPRQTDPSPAQVSASGDVVELLANRAGHYKAAVRVNGSPVNTLVDTGATYVALTNEDAERAGIYVDDADYKYRSRTANGITRVAVVTLDRVSIGGIEVRNVRASVHERGRLHISLLGMSFLGKLRRAEMQSGRLILEN